MANLTESVRSVPIPTRLSRRVEEVRTITSGFAGLSIPVRIVPVLREDRVVNARLSFAIRMSETVRPLANAVHVTVGAYLVPWSAFERFDGMDMFNRSYSKIAELAGSVVPFFTQIAFAANPFWGTLGVQYPSGKMINAGPLEAYNLLQNWRRAQRSDHIAKRGLFDTSLAECFWHQPTVDYIVPDFDPRLESGEISLRVAPADLPVRGIGIGNSLSQTPAAETVRETGGVATVNYAHAIHTSVASGAIVEVSSGAAASAWPEIYAELGGQSVGLSLAQIDQARKTQAFARMRDAYKGLDDDALVDLLMQGIRVPDASLKQPMLLASQTSILGYVTERATDGSNLGLSRTTGATNVDCSFRFPPLNTGGYIVFVAEIVPEPMFDRMGDVMLETLDPADLPNYLADDLDDQKIEIVENRFIDALHGVPNGIFGYAPLNHRWNRRHLRTGGKFYRPVPDKFVEDRARFWAVDRKNPTLNQDWYVVNKALPHTPFADQKAHPFEITALGVIEFEGLTVMGSRLTESDGQYDSVVDEIDDSQLIGDGVE